MYSFFSCREKRTFSEIKCFVLTGTGNRLAYYANIFKLCKRIIRVNVKIEQSVLGSSSAASQIENNPQLGCVQTSPISFFARGKGTFA